MVVICSILSGTVALQWGQHLQSPHNTLAIYMHWMTNSLQPCCYTLKASKYRRCEGSNLYHKHDVPVLGINANLEMSSSLQRMEICSIQLLITEYARPGRNISYGCPFVFLLGLFWKNFGSSSYCLRNFCSKVMLDGCSGKQSHTSLCKIIPSCNGVSVRLGKGSDKGTSQLIEWTCPSAVRCLWLLHGISLSILMGWFVVTSVQIFHIDDIVNLYFAVNKESFMISSSK